jgi:hypothetical protein
MIPRRGIVSGPCDGQNRAALEDFTSGVMQALSVPQYMLLVEVDGADVTLSVVNAKRQKVAGQFLLIVWTTTSQGGAPAGTCTLTVGTGSLVQTITANRTHMILTDSDGVAVVTLASAGTWYVMGGPITAADSGGPVVV